MKFETTLEKLHDALSRVHKISAKNLSLPILENVLLSLKNGQLSLRSTNLHVGVEYSFDVKENQPGEVAVNMSVLLGIISNIKTSHKLLIHTEGNSLHIQSDKSSMNINIQSPEDFPTLPIVEDGEMFKIKIEDFMDGLKSVMYSASLSDIKPEISSVYVHSEGNELVFVATDSFRLAEKRIVVENMDDFPGVIIPIKNIQDCIKIFSGLTGEFVLSLAKNQISLQNDEVYFTSRVVDGNYPNYSQIIPQEFKMNLTVLKKDLSDSLRLVNVFSDSFNQIQLQVDKSESLVNLNSRNTNVGDNTTSLEAVIDGESDISMYLNHKYLSDAFQVLDVDSLSLSFTESNRPFIVRGIGESNFLYLIMPMNR